jgi:hypothetical protein
MLADCSGSSKAHRSAVSRALAKAQSGADRRTRQVLASARLSAAVEQCVRQTPSRRVTGGLATLLGRKFEESAHELALGPRSVLRRRASAERAARPLSGNAGAMNRARGRAGTLEARRQTGRRSSRLELAAALGHVRETSPRAVSKYWKSLTQAVSGHIAPGCVMGLQRIGSARR